MTIWALKILCAWAGLNLLWLVRLCEGNGCTLSWKTGAGKRWSTGTEAVRSPTASSTPIPLPKRYCGTEWFFCVMPFRQCSVTLADTGDLKPAYSTRALSVATVGWIPYFRDLKTMPSNAYVIHPYATPSPKRPFTPAPFSVLFASGNLTEGGKPENPNPDSFLGQKGLLKMLAAKNFRGALGLDNVTISRNRDKRPLKATFDFNATVGYTPVRVQAGQQTFLQYFSRGRGSGDFTVNTDNLAVVIECWVRFKIGALMDLGCYALSGRRAPSAILKMKYRISPGYADVEFHGSKIPSHAYYMNWKRLPKTHNMLDISKAEIDGFIDSKECRDTFCAVHENFGEDATTSAYTEEVF